MSHVEGLDSLQPFYFFTSGLHLFATSAGAFIVFGLLLAALSLPAPGRTSHLLTGAVRLNKARRTEIFSLLRQHNPAPTTELHYSSPFELLVSVILSAQGYGRQRQQGYKGSVQSGQYPGAVYPVGRAGTERYIKSIGLYNTKAENIIKTCHILVGTHAAKVPESREALEKLPGVGRKTANVILNTAFGHPTIAVDTHIFRVSNRTGLAPGKNVLEVELKLLKFVPDEYKKDAHHWLILHGRYTCTARKPKCGECVIHDLCEWREKKLYRDEGKSS